MSQHQLKRSANFTRPDGPVVLIIMDGVGLGEEAAHNAVHVAKTPCLDQLMEGPLYRELKAHGTAVGMPSDADMGNSEVGHNALGAGRIFDQGAALVNQAIESGKLFKTELWNQLQSKGSEQCLHYIGLLSDGNVHSHIRHLKAMISESVAAGVKKIRLHTLLDGRDVGGRSALGYVQDLEAFIAQISEGKDVDIRIASGGGRMLMTMDRYNADWPMVKRGWDAHVLGQAPVVTSATAAIEAAYEDPDLNDQFIPPFVVTENDTPVGTIEDGDAVIFFNFRGDRAIELSMAFEQKDFTHFDRGRVPDVLFAGALEYDGDLNIPKNYLVDPPQIEGSIGQCFVDTGLSSFAISETQKYGHVTFFWNGNQSGYLSEALETYVEIPSDLGDFDKNPAMKAVEITDESIQLLKSGRYDFARINYPNGDMVGHTGNLDATVASVEATDVAVQRIVETVNELGGITVILADHGNADDMGKMVDGEWVPKTSHTLNPVPFIIADSRPNPNYELSTVDTAGLANVASTLCNLLGYEAPDDYEPSLIQAKA